MQRAAVKASECESTGMRDDGQAGSHAREGAFCLLCKGALENLSASSLTHALGSGAFTKCGAVLTAVWSRSLPSHLRPSWASCMSRTTTLEVNEGLLTLASANGFFLLGSTTYGSLSTAIFRFTDAKAPNAYWTQVLRGARAADLCAQWFSGGGPRSCNPNRSRRSARIGLHSPCGRHDRIPPRTITLRCDCALKCSGTRMRSQKSPDQPSPKSQAGPLNSG